MLPNDGGFRQLVVNGRTLLCLYRGREGYCMICTGRFMCGLEGDERGVRLG